MTSDRRTPSFSFAIRLAVLAAVGAVGLVVAGGCASKTGATEPAVKCTPGNYVFCRCQNREEGTKLCGEDGHSFGKCEPCETLDNPSIPDEPGVPPVEVDASDRDVQQPTPATCGDKIAQDGEDCDDGNKVNDDGCDDTCHLSGSNPLATRSCPGLDTHVWAKPVSYVGTTVGSTFRGSLSPNCKSDGQNPTSGASGPDRVFNVTAHKTGNMTVTTTDTDYDSLIYVTQGCVNAPTAITYLTCAHNTIGVGGETMTFPVTAGQSYSVIVDGAGISKYEGVFRLTISIQ
jgi:cysteine-rich repeat protein